MFHVQNNRGIMNSKHFIDLFQFVNINRILHEYSVIKCLIR